jgi:hypothetical protein
MKNGCRNWCLRKLAEWLEPPLKIRQFGRARREFTPEVERKMRQEIRRQLKQKVSGLNLNPNPETTG